MARKMTALPGRYGDSAVNVAWRYLRQFAATMTPEQRRLYFHMLNVTRRPMQARHNTTVALRKCLTALAEWRQLALDCGQWIDTLNTTKGS